MNLKVGSKIKAKIYNNIVDRYYPATITKIHIEYNGCFFCFCSTTKYYDLKYDDGRIEQYVTQDCIKLN